MKKTTSEKLRWLVSEHEKIVVIHTSDRCENCLKLLVKFEEVIAKEAQTDVLFVEIDSKENPIIDNVIEKQNAPYLSIYQRGVIYKDAVISNPEDFRSIIKNL